MTQGITSFAEIIDGQYLSRSSWYCFVTVIFGFMHGYMEI